MSTRSTTFFYERDGVHPECSITGHFDGNPGRYGVFLATQLLASEHIDPGRADIARGRVIACERVQRMDVGVWGSKAPEHGASYVYHVRPWSQLGGYHVAIWSVEYDEDLEVQTVEVPGGRYRVASVRPGGQRYTRLWQGGVSDLIEALDLSPNLEQPIEPF